MYNGILCMILGPNPRMKSFTSEIGDVELPGTSHISDNLIPQRTYSKCLDVS